MDFCLNEEQRMFQAMARDFAKREIEPLAAQWDAEEKFPYEVIKKMADVGLCGVGLPEEYGGSGDDLLSVILSEEIAHASAGLAVIVFCNAGLAAYPITMHGTEEQKERFIPRTVKGAISAFGLTEATAGSDPAAVRTAYAEKDDGYVLSGTKTFITNGAEADWVVTFATRDKSLGHRGISAFIVERGTPGFAVGKLERKTGIHPSSTAELIFDNCRIPKENLIGEEGRGFRISLEAIDASRVSVGAQALGIAQAAFDAAVDYAKQREQFGQVIAKFQAIQWMIADMATEIDAARMLTYRAAWLMTRKEPYLKEAAMAKIYAS